CDRGPPPFAAPSRWPLRQPSPGRRRCHSRIVLRRQVGRAFPASIVGGRSGVGAWPRETYACHVDTATPTSSAAAACPTMISSFFLAMLPPYRQACSHPTGWHVRYVTALRLDTLHASL